MSITVNDIMKLPSLRSASVVAGHGGMQRSIASISVLESIDTDILGGLFFPSDHFVGSEIVITGFLNCREDEEQQCKLIRALAEGGEIGIILYYVGVCVPKVGEKIKRLCDELDFVLIVMPEGNLDLRYSEVICEVMEAIIEDRMDNTHFTADLLMDLSRLPQHQKSVDTIMKMIRDRLHISLMLYSGERLLNSAFWPRTEENKIKDYFQNNMAELPEEGAFARVQIGSDYWVYQIPVKGEETSMHMFVFKEGGPLKNELTEEIRESVQLVVNIWSVGHNQIAVEELIRAILQDEPMKMRSLAQIYQIDVESIHAMWIIGNEKGVVVSQKFIHSLRELLYPYFKTLVIGTYNGSLVILTEDTFTRKEKEQIEDEIIKLLKTEKDGTVVMCIDGLQSTTDTSSAFHLFQNYLKDVCKIYPHKRILRSQEIIFAQTCRNIIENGTICLQTALQPLTRIQSKSEEADLIGTLEVFLLDGNSSYLRTGELMYLHTNTIKYRIKKCSDILHYQVGDMPDTISLYQAVAIQRLLK